nr:hypothetical protein [Tanacetum cinerariifolium]
MRSRSGGILVIFHIASLAAVNSRSTNHLVPGQLEYSNLEPRTEPFSEPHTEPSERRTKPFFAATVPRMTRVILPFVQPPPAHDMAPSSVPVNAGQRCWTTGQRRRTTGQRWRTTVVIGGQWWQSTTVISGEPPLTAARPRLTTTGPLLTAVGPPLTTTDNRSTMVGRPVRPGLVRVLAGCQTHVPTWHPHGC